MSILNNKQVTIDTTVPSLSIGQIQISADRRSTTTNKLTDAQRIRRVVLPVGHWGELQGSINGASSVSLTDLLREKLVEVAGARLRDVLAENPLATMVELEQFSVASLLAWNGEAAASRGSLTFSREQVEDWFDGSATLAGLKSKHAANPKLAQLLALVRNRFATLAAKNHGLKEESEVDKLLSLIDVADAENSLVVEIVGRLEHVRKAIVSKKNADTVVSMDDL